MKKILTFVLLISIFITILTVTVGASDKPLGSKEFNGHYYKYYDAKLSWSDAKTFCEQRGGHLATISSSPENEFVSSLFSCDSVWLGGNDLNIEGNFEWCTGETFSYSNWGNGEPNDGAQKGQDYIHIYKSGLWDDIQDTELGFVCEWEIWEDNIETSIPSDAISFNNHFYKFVSLEYDWETAEYYCEKCGGHLATVSSDDENKFINQLAQSQSIWLGGSDAANEGVFEWISGELFYYSNWASGEPNNGRSVQDYIQMYDNGRWDDEEYKIKKKFVCEWDYCCVSENGCYDKHNWGEWQTASEAKCGKEGEQHRICLLCGIQESEVIPALTHKYGEWYTIEEAKCGQAGLEERKCLLCENVEDRELVALDHEYCDFKIISGSKIIPPIVKERKCNLCGSIDHVDDWSNIWITILAFVGAIGVLIGIVGYVRAFVKKS